MDGYGPHSLHRQQQRSNRVSKLYLVLTDKTRNLFCLEFNRLHHIQPYSFSKSGTNFVFLELSFYMIRCSIPSSHRKLLVESGITSQNARDIGRLVHGLIPESTTLLRRFCSITGCAV